jgi:hypothetical protein
MELLFVWAAVTSVSHAVAVRPPALHVFLLHLEIKPTCQAAHARRDITTAELLSV